MASGMGDVINPIENTGKPRLLGSSAKCTTWPCDIDGQGPPLRTRFLTLLRFLHFHIPNRHNALALSTLISFEGLDVR
jgi:hypothetical protein